MTDSKASGIIVAMFLCVAILIIFFLVWRAIKEDQCNSICIDRGYRYIDVQQGSCICAKGTIVLPLEGE